MKAFTLVLACLSLSTIVSAQHDMSRPTSRTDGRDDYSATSLAHTSGYKFNKDSLDSKHRSVIGELKSKWQSCGGDSSGMTTLISVADHINIARAAIDNPVQELDTVSCNDLAIRYRCMVKDGGLNSLNSFANSAYVDEYLEDEYRISRPEGKKLASTLKKICRVGQQ